jgi:hypothetical protein
MARISRQGRCGSLLLAGALMIAPAPAHASANIGCMINDKFITFELEAIAGRSGPILQVHQGSIVIKPAAGITPSKPEITFGMPELSQQWIFDGDLKLDIDIYDEKTREHVELVIQARLDRTAEKFFGKYLLRVERDQRSKEHRGRIKECVAG